MRSSPIISLAAFGSLVDAGWINPLGGWNSITFTLPGATFKKRSLPRFEPEPEALDLETRANKGYGSSNNDLYASCGWYNLASKYNRYPINGFAFSAAYITSFPVTDGTDNSAAGSAGAGSSNSGQSGASAGAGVGNASISSPIQTRQVSASSAYDCCVAAMQDSMSAMFFYTSNPPAFSDGSAQQKCTIVTNQYCPMPKTEVILLAASYNASAPRGTSYGNYIGNGNCGPGVRIAVNNANAAVCAANSAGATVYGGGQGASAVGAGAACAYSDPRSVPDQGGANPVGAGAAASSASGSNGTATGTGTG